jgi:micrococcal nuclease
VDRLFRSGRGLPHKASYIRESEMKKLLSRIILLAICGTALALACRAAQATPDSNAIQKDQLSLTAAAIAQTQTALVPTKTSTPTVPPPTNTPNPTATLMPTPTSLAPCVPTNVLQEATVSRVIDGDTIEITIGGTSYKVRYIGIDTPEATTEIEYFGKEATAKNKELVEGKIVTLIKDVSEVDKYDRLLRYVFVGKMFVNYELVKEGYATVATYPPDVSCAEDFLTAQQYARENNKGLWAPTPTPPASPTVRPTIAPTEQLPPPPPPSKPTKTTKPSGGGNCDPSYPTVCIPPPPPDLDCKDIPYRRFQVLPPDPHRFDGDHDGIGCES